MSAFIVSEKTMNQAIHAICLRNRATFANFNLKTQEGRDALGNALFDLNNQAVNSRYRTSNAWDASGELSCRTKTVLVTNMQAYKSLSCLIYQCAEDGAVDTDLFKQLERVAGSLAGYLISQTAEYQKGAWDA